MARKLCHCEEYSTKQSHCMAAKSLYVYIMTNRSNTVFYTGVTNNLLRRADEHRSGIHLNSFTKKYQIFKLVYYESGDSAEGAICREKQIKGGSRQKKINLIVCKNSTWKDLYEELSG